MKFSQYQEKQYRTQIIQESWEKGCTISALGLGGEAGEVLDIVKKHFGHNKELDEAHLKEELGDVLWYVSSLCNLFDLSLDDVATTNIIKLQKRYG